jgi:hypothetical protein
LTKDALFPTYSGASSECLSIIYPGRVEAERGIDFLNGAVNIICVGSIDTRGDINLNGIPYEIGDAVVFSNCLILGNDDCSNSFAIPCPTCSDLNGDDIFPTIEDFILCWRIIMGDSKPLPEIDTTFMGELAISESDSIIKTFAQCEQPIGGMLFKFYSRDSTVKAQIGVSINYMDYGYAWRKDTLRILIFSYFDNKTIPSSLTEILTIKYSLQKPKLVSASAAGYYGEKINLTIQDILSVDETGDDHFIPDNFVLYQNYPNPFNSNTEIKFLLPIKSDWNLRIFDISGRKIRNFEGISAAGEVRIFWDGTDRAGQSVSSGVYFYRLEVDDRSLTKKMTLLK